MTFLNHFPALAISTGLCSALGRIRTPKTLTMEFCVLGPKRIGKTTLLTGIYNSLKEITAFREKQYSIIVDNKTNSMLNENADKLKKMANESTFRLRTDLGFEATGEKFSYLFDFSHENSKNGQPFLQTKFYDYPGGWLNSEDEKDQMAVNTLCADCQVSMIIIDAPSLMEKDGVFHQRLNKPDMICELFARNYKGLQEPRLVLLVPVRCESYIDRLEDLQNRILKEYSKLIKYFKSESLRNFVNLAIIPVCTLGNVVFSRIEEENEEVLFFFKKRKNQTYTPKDCEQTLIYTLEFLSNLCRQKPRHLTGLNYTWIRKLFNLDQDLSQFIEVLRAEKKKYHIIQGDYI